MKRLFSFILDILEKKDPEIASLENKDVNFWNQLATPKKIGKDTIYFFSYQEKQVKKAILAIKTKNNRTLLGALVQVAAEYMIEELSEMRAWQNFAPEVMIAIPPSSGRKGFNQSEEIAREMIRLNLCDGVQFLKNILIKTKTTPIQHSLPREKRLKNLCNSMAVKTSEKIKGRDILLVDDVTTTGATFKEATRALKKAGAKKVFCIALAH